MARKRPPQAVSLASRGTPHEDHSPPPGLPFPIVAVGASAGGLEAFNELLHSLPGDTGMAFVMVQHLSPTHASLLADILARSTPMPVAQVENNMAIAPDHIYVIPPGKSMVLAEGHLQLSPRTELRGQARPIDQFMRSLAEGHGHKAIGVVLSGTGNDGTLGIEAIKAGGGITFVQDSTAEHGSMPRSAIAAGAVDYVLAPADIARELARIARHPHVAPGAEPGQPFGEPELQQVIELLHTTTGVDFSNYKRNTLYRRITRRLLLHRIDSPRDYLRLLRETPAEVEALFQDVLINVTSFFRDPEAYDALKEHVFPKLTEDRNRNEPVRVWAIGCSTGEEAYSIAMAFSEYLEESGRRVPMQVFATDLNNGSVERARAATYGKGIAHDVSPERLRRFFVEVDGSYRISRPIRDMCVFARQNVLSDPPFSRIDLVACRNVLIYLEPVLQQKLIPLLHYSLRSNGFLWLGSSETIGSYRDLFELLDVKDKIYARKQAGRGALAFSGAGSRWIPQAAPPAAPPREAAGIAQKEADRMLLTRYAPPGVLLSDDLEIVQFRGDTSPYLSPAPGKASLNLLKMLREGLMVAVRGAVARARRDKLPAREEGLRVKSNGGWRTVDVVVLPIKVAEAAPASLLVLFEEPAHSIEARARRLEEQQAAHDAAAQPQAGDESARLKDELDATRDYLQSVIEQQDAANEELQSANEEVQSANEELQSINEELETSKEEIQSTNEELATVNDELRDRNLELSQTNNDLVNLVSSVQVGIVMLGPDLRIRRYTPAAEKPFNLLPSDIGRPFAHVKARFQIPDLESMLLEVIETVSIREREVRDAGGHWYVLRVRPYRTLENKIDGAVVMLVDIDTLKRTEQALRESESRFEMLANSAPVPIWINDLDGCRFVNRAFEEFVGEIEADIRSSAPSRFVHPDEREAYAATYEAAARAKQPFRGRFRFRRADGEFRRMEVVATPRLLPDGDLVGYVGCTFDVTDFVPEAGARPGR